MNRTERINLRVTADEKARLEALALNAGKSMTAYILDEIRGPEQRFVMNQYIKAAADAETALQLVKVLESAKQDGDLTSNSLAIINQIIVALSDKFIRR